MNASTHCKVQNKTRMIYAVPHQRYISSHSIRAYMILFLKYYIVYCTYCTSNTLYKCIYNCKCAPESINEVSNVWQNEDNTNDTTRSNGDIANFLKTRQSINFTIRRTYSHIYDTSLRTISCKIYSFDNISLRYTHTSIYIVYTYTYRIRYTHRTQYKPYKNAAHFFFRYSQRDG